MKKTLGLAIVKEFLKRQLGLIYALVKIGIIRFW